MSDAVSAQFSYGKGGCGDYGAVMGEQQYFNIDAVKDRIFSAVESIPVQDSDTNRLFTIADFGTADGSCTMPLVTQLIEMVRQKHGEIPIQVVYEDQASSDFNSLLKRVHGLIPDPPTYLKRFSKVFVMASGTSFYSQVLPDNTAHLILCLNAPHYLSELPTRFQNSLHRYPDATEAEGQLVAAQAAQDWETFLLHRARELKAGGMLVASSPCDDPEMKLEGIRHCVQGYEEGMAKVWRHMRDEGQITQEEFLDTNFQRCTRYMQEITAPLEDPDSAVYKAGLRLFKADTVLTPCVHQKLWRRKLEEEGVDTRTSWAKTVLNQHRVWTNNAFIHGLSRGTRSQQEREALVEELYQRLEKEILAQGPERFKNGCLLNYVFVQKV